MDTSKVPGEWPPVRWAKDGLGHDHCVTHTYGFIIYLYLYMLCIYRDIYGDIYTYM